MYNESMKIEISSKNIAWPSDVKNKFKRAGENWRNIQWTDVEDG